MQIGWQCPSREGKAAFKIYKQSDSGPARGSFIVHDVRSAPAGQSELGTMGFLGEPLLLYICVCFYVVLWFMCVLSLCFLNELCAGPRRPPSLRRGRTLQGQG